jgi:uncharacterized membrane protein YgcG
LKSSGIPRFLLSLSSLDLSPLLIHFVIWYSTVCMVQTVVDHLYFCRPYHEEVQLQLQVTTTGRSIVYTYITHTHTMSSSSSRPVYVPRKSRRGSSSRGGGRGGNGGGGGGRFHGAFTGGFSAGYFNTVGSAEGWQPRQQQQQQQQSGVPLPLQGEYPNLPGFPGEP